MLATGLEDPQAMRMILLQILTGRRASEIRTCDVRLPVRGSRPPRRRPTGPGRSIRFRYAQSKIDIAPDTILVDREVTEVIEEQQRWIRDQPPARRAAASVRAAPGQPPRRQTLPVRHLQLDAARAQQPRSDHRQPRASQCD